MQALHGFRVVDFTHVFAGPFCTSQLGAQGADVIKVEGVDTPDMMRPEGTHLGLDSEGRGSQFIAQSANKRSMAVAIDTREGRAVVEQLIETADVVVENFRPGVLARHGLDGETLCARHPKLIYCSISGFGQTGPKAPHPAYDNVIQAFSGMMAMTGGPDSGPIRVGPPVLDYGTGAQAAFAIVSALLRRERSGEGQRIDVAMLDCALMLMSNGVVETQVQQHAPVRFGNTSKDRHAYGCFDTADGQLVVGAFTLQQTVQLYRELGAIEDAVRIECGGRSEMIKSAAKGQQILAECFLTQGAQYWEDRLNNAGIPAARIRDLHESLAEAQVGCRAVLADAQQGAANGLKTPVAGFCSEIDGPSIRQPAPRHGEHTDNLLLEIGLDAVAINTLRDAGVVA